MGWMVIFDGGCYRHRKLVWNEWTFSYLGRQIRSDLLQSQISFFREAIAEEMGLIFASLRSDTGI